MKKPFSSLTILMVMFLVFTISPTCIFSKIQVGEEVIETYETPHPYTGKGLVWEQEFYWPDAGYIAVHFSNFDLEKGDYVEISSPDGRFRYLFKEKGKDVLVGNGNERKQEQISEFWATHIPGDTAIVRLISSHNKRNGYGFIIDKWARGYARGYIEAMLEDLETEAMIEAICSADNKEWAKCYEGTTIYNKARAVCRLLIGGTGACTGWLLGSEGHIITNNHCISTQASASDTDYEFMAEGATCATNCASWGACPGTVAASSGTLIKTSSTLDYTLILLPTNVTSTYGYLQLRNTLPTIGERIYIPQHPGAWGKQLAVNSDVDGGYAKIYSTNQTPCIGGPGDIGYYADTAGGSSGSPVLAYSDHLVVALHHCGTCPNRGVPIPSIITDLGTSIPDNALYNAEDLVVRTSDARLLLFPFENGIFTGTGTQVGHGWNFTHYFVGHWNTDYPTHDLIVRKSNGELWLYPYRNETFYTYGSKRVGQNFNYTHYFVGNWTDNATDDLIVRDSSGCLWLFPYANGTFGAGISLGCGWNYTHYFVGNWSGDNFSDLICRDSSGYMWYYRFENGVFVPPTQVGNGWNFINYFVGNWTGDGTDDLIVRESNGNMKLYPFRNGSFYGVPGSGTIVAYGWNFTDYFVGDWANSTTDDMVVRESNGTMKLYPFVNGTFGTGTTAGTGFNYTHYFVGQWTND